MLKRCLKILIEVLGYNKFMAKTKTKNTKKTTVNKPEPLTNLSLKNIDLSDSVFKNAYEMIDDPLSPNLFITGGGGTGKSIILEHYYKTLTYRKFKTAVVCPTGVAASILTEKDVYAKTIHSLFLLPPQPLFEKTIDMPREKRRLLKNLDYLLIDEVSMIPPSLFDHMGWILREVGFKGKVIMFGDVAQLSPVVNLSNDAILDYYLSEHYISSSDEIPQFYDSKYYKELSPKIILLNKIYRQEGQEFASILKRIRLGEESDEDLEIINSRVIPRNEFYEDHPNMLYLSSVNSIVNRINARYNASFVGHPYMEYVSISEGSLKKDEEEVIRIYEGQQIMCTHNNAENGYQNGTMGIVEKVEENCLYIRNHNDELVKVERETWEDFKLEYDMKNHEVKILETGVYNQIAAKPAFASTIHKAQGLTLDYVYLDLSSSFIPPASVYLALSRCRTLSGLGLSRPIRHSDIVVDKKVVDFYKNLLN